MNKRGGPRLVFDEAVGAAYVEISNARVTNSYPTMFGEDGQGNRVIVRWLIGFRPFGLLACTLLLTSACAYLERAPGSEMDLGGTSWVVESFDGRAAPPGYQIDFVSLDEASIVTPCRQVDAGLVVDSDGAGLGFVDPAITFTDCDPHQAAEDARLTEEILSTESWRILESGAIELVGLTRIELARQ